MEATVKLPNDMWFVPRWLSNINPYVASVLTARIITPLPYHWNVGGGQVKVVFGQTSYCGTIMEARPERRTAKDIRRIMEEQRQKIMEERRQACIAAFTKEDV